MEYELYHWGIKGMKWGIRRFQNKDGSLTSAGRKRYGDGSDGSYGGGKTKASKTKTKTTKDMTDDELRTRINRLQLEKNALDLENQVSSLSPQKVAKGKGFVQKIGKEVIAPALLNAGRTQLTNFLNDRLSKALGLNSKDDMAALRKVVDELNLKKQKSELEKWFKNSGKDQTSESDALRKAVEELNLKKQKSELEKWFKNSGKDQTSESDVLAKLAKDLENKGKIAKNAQYGDIEEILKELLEKEKKS